MADGRKPIDMGGAFTGVPLCSYERCPSYSGKRCGETGNEPDQVCIPEVRALRSEFDHLRSIMGVDRRRLADGAEPMVGQRVVKVRAVADAWRMPHAYDEKVHEITSLLGGDTHLVELGPEQVGVAMLQLAPRGAEVTCPSCAGWRDQMARMRADAEVYRREQIGEVHRIKAELESSRVNAERLRKLIVESCAAVGVLDDEDNAYRAVQLLARELARVQVQLANATERRHTLPYATPIDGSAPACIYPPDGKTAREILDEARRRLRECSECGATGYVEHDSEGNEGPCAACRGEATVAERPRCHAQVLDHDGFGALAHVGPGGCGYCRHPSRDFDPARRVWVCGICGEQRNEKEQRER